MQRDRSVSEPLDALAKDAGAGVRTLERLFVKETGMTFRRWRQRARLLAALHRLAAGEPVTSTALSVGFRSTSAFIAMYGHSAPVEPDAPLARGEIEVNGRRPSSPSRPHRSGGFAMR